jgi:hypothetical protein
MCWPRHSPDQQNNADVCILNEASYKLQCLLLFVSLCAVCLLVLQYAHGKQFSPRSLIAVRQFCCIGVGWPTSSFRSTQSEILLSWHLFATCRYEVYTHRASGCCCVYHVKMFLFCLVVSHDRSKASSKASSPHSAICSFLLQMRVASP